MGVDTDASDQPRTVVLTSPPTDLSLSWDAALVSFDTLDIVLSVLTADEASGTAKLEDIATLANGVTNVGLHVIPATDLSAVDADVPDGALVLFKVSKSADVPLIQPQC